MTPLHAFWAALVGASVLYLVFLALDLRTARRERLRFERKYMRQREQARKRREKYERLGKP